MKDGITRRVFLFLLAALAAFPLWKYLSPRSVDAQGLTVPIGDLPENGVYMLRDKKAAVIRKNNEIRAVSIACTHLGCTLNVADDKFVCPCHGSVFSLDGKVLNGPATIDLRELRHSIDGDKIILYV
jgi:Rieske Fe-S protein